MKTKNGSGRTLGYVLMKGRTVIALLILVIIFSLLLANKGINFLNPVNIMTVAKHVAIVGIMAIGMTFVIITGGIDLSVGSVVGIAGMVAGALIRVGLPLELFGVTIYFHVWMIVLICCALGMGIGALNGWLVTKLNVAPFIATLGMMYIARGFANIMSNGSTYPDLQGKPELGNQGFPMIGAGSFLYIPFSVWIMILILAVMSYVAMKTPLGRHVYAIGGNSRAARLSGIRVERVTLMVYMFSGFCAALVGLVVSSQLVAAHPATGESYEMNAIAAAVLGGTSMSGGIGSVGGTVVGAFVIGVLSDGLVMMGVSEFWQNVFKGLVIILAVVFDQANQRMNKRLSVTEEKKPAKA